MNNTEMQVDLQAVYGRLQKHYSEAMTRICVLESQVEMLVNQNEELKAQSTNNEFPADHEVITSKSTS